MEFQETTATDWVENLEEDLAKELKENGVSYGDPVSDAMYGAALICKALHLMYEANSPTQIYLCINRLNHALIQKCIERRDRIVGSN